MTGRRSKSRGIRARPLRDEILIEMAGPGEDATIVTVVEWESDGVVGVVGPRVSEFHQRIGFEPGAFFARHGIGIDRSGYRSVRNTVAGSA